MPTPFVDFLHRDGFSLKHALGSMKDIIPVLQERGQTHYAVANYGECSGWVQQLFACRKAGIVPILGFEAYVNDYRARTLPDGGIAVKSLATGQDRPLAELGDLERDLVTQDYPIALYARTLEGYHNVLAIHNDAQLEGFGDRPRTSNPFLQGRGRGVVAVMPFPYGEVATLLYNGETEAAKRRVAFYREIFDEVAIGIPFGEAEDYPDIADAAYELALATGTRAIPVANSHYVHPADAEAFQVLRRLARQRGGIAMYDTDIVPGMHYRSREEMDGLWRERFNSRVLTPMAWRGLLGSLDEFAASFADLDIDLDLKLPKFADGPAKLRAAAEAGFKAKGYDRKGPAYRQRLEYELENIAGAGFSDYFLVLDEFYRWYKEQGAVPAFGRGSAAGSLVLNCIGGTGLDPLEHNLLFERFLDAERFRLIVEKGGKVSGADCPDVDSDCATTRRGALKEHLAERYGENCVASIGTVGTMQTKSALKSLARLYDIDPQEINQVTSVEMADFADDEENPKTIEDLRAEYHGLARLLDAHPQMAAVFGTLHGSIDSWGVHAGGVLITDFDLRDQLPLRRGKDGQTVTCWQEGIAARELGQMGFIKFDILGIDKLNIIEDILRLIRENRGVEIDVDKIPLGDYKALKQMDRHDSIAVFQFDTALTGKVTDHMGGIRSFADLGSLTTLMRPAALKNHFDVEFGNRRAGRSECYIPDCLKPYLGDTYGLPIYQEHIMQIAMAAAGFDKATAYKFMKLIYKGKLHTQAEKDEWRAKFVAGCRPKVESGELPADYPDRIFDQILAFLGYGFCKSHGLAYSKYSAVDLWLKAYYPLEYMCANLTVTPRSKEKKGVAILAQRVAFCRSIGIEVLPPLVELAGTEWRIHDGKLIAPLSNLNGFGSDEARKIESLRPFADLKDFVSRTGITESRFDKLCFGGALDSFGEREFLFNWFRWWQKTGKKGNARQQGLFGDDGAEDEIPIAETFTPLQLEAAFEEMNGFSLPEILPRKYAALIEGKKCYSVAMAKARKTPKHFPLLCRVASAEPFTARSGAQFVRLELSDGADSVETILKAGVWRSHPRLLSPGKALLLPMEQGEKDGVWVDDLDRRTATVLED